LPIRTSGRLIAPCKRVKDNLLDQPGNQLLHGICTYDNVLKAETWLILRDPSEPWLAIDPSPSPETQASNSRSPALTDWQDVVATGTWLRAVRMRFGPP